MSKPLTREEADGADGPDAFSVTAEIVYRPAANTRDDL